MSLYALCMLVLTAICWGVTNPFLKKGGSGIENIKRHSKFTELLAKLNFVIFNWKCVAPLLINQFGSVLYFLSLSSTDLSVAVPVANSLTLLFTTFTGWWLNEKIDKESIIGSILIVSGVCLCIIGNS
ncbi:transmembrane protein 234 homolog isoform X2 [Ciona intestinalis]